MDTPTILGLKLKSNKNAVIQKFDNGNSVAAIDRLKYVRKMEELLSDCSKFYKFKTCSKPGYKTRVKHGVGNQILLG